MLKATFIFYSVIHFASFILETKESAFADRVTFEMINR